MYRYFIESSNNDRILSLKSKGLSDGIVKPPTTCDNILDPALSFLGNKKE